MTYMANFSWKNRLTWSRRCFTVTSEPTLDDGRSAQYLVSGYMAGVKCAHVVRIDSLNGDADNRDSHRQRGRIAAGMGFMMDQAKQQASKQARELPSCCRPTASLLTGVLRAVVLL